MMKSFQWTINNIFNNIYNLITGLEKRKRFSTLFSWDGEIVNDNYKYTDLYLHLTEKTYTMSSVGYHYQLKELDLFFLTSSTHSLVIHPVQHE